MRRRRLILHLLLPFVMLGVVVAESQESTRNLGFIDSIFGLHKMDGGSTIPDFIVVPLGFLVCCGHLAIVYKMWSRRNVDLALKVKSMTLVAIQSLSGVVWYIGFVVRFGHFARPEYGVFSACSFWNYYISEVFGFALWSGCILFRLLRLYYFFIMNKSDFVIPGTQIILSFKDDWFKILGIFCTPLVTIYGVFLPLLGSNVHKLVGGKYICVYEGRLGAVIDTITFVAAWLALFYFVHALRNVNDQFGEYKSIRKALFVSVSCLGSLILVDLCQIDGLFFGRTLVTSSVLASVTFFFYTQNQVEIKRVLIGDTTIDRSLEAEVSLAEAGGADESILEGGISPPQTPQKSSYDFNYGNDISNGGVRQRPGLRKQQSEFTRAILLD